MASVYAPGGVLIVFGGPEAKAHDAIRKLVGNTIATYEWIFQMTHSGLILIDGDVATSRWWVTEMAYRGEGKATQFFGVCQDRVVRTNAGWRFACRRLDATCLARLTLEGKHFLPPDHEQGLWPQL